MKEKKIVKSIKFQIANALYKFMFKEEKNNPCILYTCTYNAIKTTLCM